MSRVFEYFLDENRFITGWAEHNSKNRPDLIGIPLPEDFPEPHEDEYGNPRIRLVNNEFVVSEQIPTTAQINSKSILKIGHIVAEGFFNIGKRRKQGEDFGDLNALLDEIITLWENS